MAARPSSTLSLALAIIALGAVIAVWANARLNYYGLCHPGGFQTKAETEHQLEQSEEREFASRARNLRWPAFKDLWANYNVLTVKVGADSTLSAQEVESVWQAVFAKAHGLQFDADACTSVALSDEQDNLIGQAHWPRPWWVFEQR